VCETWSVTLRDEHRLRVFENRVLRRIFGLQREEIAGGWGRLHNGELSYGLDDRASEFRFPAGAGNFSLHHRVQERLWGPPSLLSNGYQGLFPWE
jgi:hypothetical protein